MFPAAAEEVKDLTFSWPHAAEVWFDHAVFSTSFIDFTLRSSSHKAFVSVIRGDESFQSHCLFVSFCLWGLAGCCEPLWLQLFNVRLLSGPGSFSCRFENLLTNKPFYLNLYLNCNCYPWCIDIYLLKLIATLNIFSFCRNWSSCCLLRCDDNRLHSGTINRRHWCLLKLSLLQVHRYFYYYSSMHFYLSLTYKKHIGHCVIWSQKELWRRN